MKIYNKIVINIESGKIVEEDSFDYSGPVDMCGGSGKTIGTTIFDPLNLSGVRTPDAPKPPAKTATENALDQTELDLLKIQVENQKKQQASAAEMEPFQLEAMGYKRDETGKIVKIDTSGGPETILRNKQLAMMGYSPTGERLSEEQMLSSMTDSEKSDYNLSKLSRQRQMDALEGKLPVSPALEEELAGEERQAEELLARKLGPNWMLSTPGQKAMSTLRQKASLLREEARRGQITTGEGLLASRSNQDALKQQQISSMTGQISGTKGTELDRMQGFIKSKSGGNAFDDAMSLSGKYASERANEQNLAMQQWTARTNSQNSQSSGLMSAAAAAAA